MSLSRFDPQATSLLNPSDPKKKAASIRPTPAVPWSQCPPLPSRFNTRFTHPASRRANFVL
jgi:hypothetical protein